MLDINWYKMAENRELLENIYNMMYNLFNIFKIEGGIEK